MEQRKTPRTLVETPEELIKRGVRELTHADLKAELVDPPQVFNDTFFQADNTTRNAYNIARFAAREQLVLFERRLFEWLKDEGCADCPRRHQELPSLEPEKAPELESSEALRFPSVVKY